MSPRNWFQLHPWITIILIVMSFDGVLTTLARGGGWYLLTPVWLLIFIGFSAALTEGMGKDQRR